MQELQRLIDALDLMCESANRFHQNAGIERTGDGRLHAEVRATLWTRNCADVQADIILMGTRRTVNGNGDIADEHVRRVVAHTASIPSKSRAPLYLKTGDIGTVVNEIHLSMFSQVVNGLRDGTIFDLDLDPSTVSDPLEAKCAESGCVPDGATLIKAAKRLSAALNTIRGGGAKGAEAARQGQDGVQMTAEHPIGRPADGESTEATVETDSSAAVAGLASDMLVKHLKALVTAFGKETGTEGLHFTNYVSDNVIRITVGYDVITAATVNFTVRPKDTASFVAHSIYAEILDSLCSYFKVGRDRIIRACEEEYGNLPAKAAECDATVDTTADDAPKPTRRRSPRKGKEDK